MHAERFCLREALGGEAHGTTVRDRESILRIVEPPADDIQAVLEHDHRERCEEAARSTATAAAVRVLHDAALKDAGLKRVEDVGLVTVGLCSVIGDVRKPIAIGGELGAFLRRGSLLEL